jgi:hypothetical protein
MLVFGRKRLFIRRLPKEKILAVHTVGQVRMLAKSASIRMVGHRSATAVQSAKLGKSGRKDARGTR